MTTDKHPFERIALTLSGGGTRAMGFHLGTMSYLDRVSLLEKVRILSTVSGGTVIGLGYAVYQQLPKDNEKPLLTLYKEISEKIPSNPAEFLKMLQEATSRYPVAPSGRRTLTYNFAEMCNTVFNFCDNNRFDIFWDGAPTHLEEIIFNVTELMTGGGFVFHKSHNEEGSYSKSEISMLPEKYARQARLADIVSASACTPIAFEPIVFPDDFRWPDDISAVPSHRKICDEIRQELPTNPEWYSKNSITLMDGGIYDNQGIFSVLKILGLSQRKSKGNNEQMRSDTNLTGLLGDYQKDSFENRQEKDIDLFIVSDTPLRGFPLYDLAQKPKEKSFLDLIKLKWIFYGALFSLLGSTAFLLFHYLSLTYGNANHSKFSLGIVRDLFIYTIPVIITSAIMGFTRFLSHRIASYFGKQPSFFNNPDLKSKLWKYLKKLKFSDIGSMFESRLSSAFAISNDVFLNRIRYLGLVRILNLPPLKGKVIINAIDSLILGVGETQMTNEATLESQEGMNSLLRDTKILREDTVAKAASVPTAPWLSREDLMDLIACGQATICYNLLKHMQFMIQRNPSIISDGKFKEIYDRLEKDWQNLKANPYCLVQDPYWNPE